MRTRRTRLLCALLAAALIALPGAALGQDSGELISDLGQGTAVIESETLGTLDDYRWAPVGIGRTADTLILRPIALALTALTAVTFSFAVLPSLVTGDEERTSALYDGMIREPIKYAILRPPFSPADHFDLLDEIRAAEEALALEAAEDARRAAENARLEEEAAKRAAEQAEAEARAARLREIRGETEEGAGGANDMDGKAEAGERPPR